MDQTLESLIQKSGSVLFVSSNLIYIHIHVYIQGVSGGIVNILGGGSMDYSE